MSMFDLRLFGVCDDACSISLARCGLSRQQVFSYLYSFCYDIHQIE